MNVFTTNQIMELTEKWLVTGELNEKMLADNFHFISPFWECSDKSTFVNKFLDPTEYKEKSLSNILRFDPIIKLTSDDKRNFSIILQYHTKHKVRIDEAVLGTVENGLLVELRSIYDLEKTKLAHAMMSDFLQKTGQCRCGQTKFTVNSEPLITMACHCTGCQRMTSSAFSLSALYASDEFNITSGEPVIGGLHGATRHYFCAHCMSWLYTRLEGMDEFVNVRASLLDDARSYSPFVETYTSEKLPWAVTPAEHSFKKFPDQEVFPELLSEFAKR